MVYNLRFATRIDNLHTFRSYIQLMSLTPSDLPNPQACLERVNGHLERFLFNKITAKYIILHYYLMQSLLVGIEIVPAKSVYAASN
jgi:hypothetical protein